MKSDKRFSKQEITFWVLFAGIAVYYGWRLFALTPWYDELYTYYYFISKGPVYAAIHWPLPNNHVGYSVLSAFLDFWGNSYIGLRGVSYLCALANLYLVFRLAERWTKGWMPVCAVILYLSANLVNQMAVQGRGYTLGITCFLAAFFCMAKICEEKQVKRRYYLLYVCSLTMGLYTVTSNVYWVMPLCLAGGFYLLILCIRESQGEKKFFLKTASGKKLLMLIGASLAAAILTIGLYTVIWLAIGSNLLVKDETSMYYGLSHGKMILSAPFAAIGRGVEYMLDTPYIQSETRAGFAGRLGEFLVTLSGYYFNSLAVTVVLIWVIGLVVLAWKLIWQVKSGIKEKNFFENKFSENTFSGSIIGERMLTEIFLLLEIIFVPVCLLIQCKRPYYRVFTYGGVLLSLLIIWLLEEMIRWIRLKRGNEGIERKGQLVILLFVAALGVKCLFFSGYGSQYGDREHEIQTVLSHVDMQEVENFCVTDCNQQYLLHFLYGIRCENREIEGADMVVLDKRMTDPDFDEMIWEFYHYYDTIPWNYIDQNMHMAYESENYLLYQVNEKER